MQYTFREISSTSLQTQVWDQPGCCGLSFDIPVTKIRRKCQSMKLLLGDGDLQVSGLAGPTGYTLDIPGSPTIEDRRVPALHFMMTRLAQFGTSLYDMPSFNTHAASLLDDPIIERPNDYTVYSEYPVLQPSQHASSACQVVEAHDEYLTDATLQRDSALAMLEGAVVMDTEGKAATLATEGKLITFVDDEVSPISNPFEYAHPDLMTLQPAYFSVLRPTVSHADRPVGSQRGCHTSLQKPIRADKSLPTQYDPTCVNRPHDHIPACTEAPAAKAAGLKTSGAAGSSDRIRKLRDSEYLGVGPLPESLRIAKIEAAVTTKTAKARAKVEVRGLKRKAYVDGLQQKYQQGSRSTGSGSSDRSTVRRSSKSRKSVSKSSTESPSRRSSTTAIASTRKPLPLPLSSYGIRSTEQQAVPKPASGVTTRASTGTISTHKTKRKPAPLESTAMEVSLPPLTAERFPFGKYIPYRRTPQRQKFEIPTPPVLPALPDFGSPMIHIELDTEETQSSSFEITSSTPVNTTTRKSTPPIVPQRNSSHLCWKNSPMVVRRGTLRQLGGSIIEIKPQISRETASRQPLANRINQSTVKHNAAVPIPSFTPDTKTYRESQRSSKRDSGVWIVGGLDEAGYGYDWSESRNTRFQNSVVESDRQYGSLRRKEGMSHQQPLVQF